MTEKELHKLKRAELLEILLIQSKQIAVLKKRLKETEEKLQSREIMIEQAGSIAEASLRLNHIFEDAQKAADQYLENIRSMSRRKDENQQGEGSDEKEE